MKKRKDYGFNLAPANLPADAVAKQARPGIKAGNPGIDSFYEQKRREKIKSVSDTYDEMEKSIVDMIKTVKGIIEAQMPGLRKEVESIIQYKTKSDNLIERTLDTLLDCMNMGLGEEEFNMLNKYYSTVNKSGYRFYQREYKKLKEEK